MSNQSKINFAKIGILSDFVCDEPERLFDALGVSLEKNGKKFVGACPIHDGDNCSAFNIYTEGDYYRGNWKCRTKSCNNLYEPSTLELNPKRVFSPGLIGFIQGVLSAKKLKWLRPGDKKMSYWEAVRWVCDLYGVDLDNLKIDDSKLDKKDFLSSTRYLVAQSKAEGMPRDKVRSKLIYPCEYFLKRGFSREILDVFDVGYCNTPGKIMSGRAVCPVYEESGQFMIGASGRLVEGEGPKWIHDKFKASENLYGYWIAAPHIKKSGAAILVESPANCWRMHECGYQNTVGLFGTEFSIAKQFLLEKLGVTSICTVLDNDEAGNKARKTITDDCSRYYNINHIIPPANKNDVGEMGVEEVREMMKYGNN